jgi:DnaJ-domain-containing protein 1
LSLVLTRQQAVLWMARQLRKRLGRLKQVERRLEELEQDFTALEHPDRELSAENRQLHEFLAQAIDAQISAIVDGTPASMGQDPYAILGVTQTAPREVIEAAYRALARMYHPDKGGSTAAMQRINQAYD